jgi:HK97 family phage prohead protease
MHETEEGPLKIQGMASTDAVDRAGDIILASAWAEGSKNFMNNPIVLFNHDYSKPIGKVTELSVTATGLLVTAEISSAAEHVYQMVKEGILSTFSVGFLIKDADYNKVTDGLIIKSVELLEISVVTVPCNQTAVFSLAKSFATEDDYNEFKNEYKAGHSLAITSDKLSGTNVPMERKLMDPDEIKALVLAATNENARVAAEEKRAAEARTAEVKAVAEEAVKNVAVQVLSSGAERLYSELEAKMKSREESFSQSLNENMEAIKTASAELIAMRDSKRNFGDRTSGKVWHEDAKMYQAVDDAVILGLASRKGLTGTRFGAATVEKVNTMSGVQVNVDDFEQTVSTNIERDIQNELVLAPLFREIALTSATQILPILPDSGYAQITSTQVAGGSNPNGNLAQRGDTYGTPWGGVTTDSVTLSTVKFMSQSYLGQETEEDAIMPILPLIRESIIRSHARGMENMILAGNHADGTYTTGAVNGLIKLATIGGRQTIATATVAADALTAARLLAARKAMGKYGVRPKEVIYIVSQRAYFELLQDAAYQDWDQVGNMATKLTGEVGLLFGSKVFLCDEFAAPAVSTGTTTSSNKYYALAVNTRNFLVPRLRGFRLESDYVVANQSTVIVGTQRVGFQELISGATAVHGIYYSATAS